MKQSVALHALTFNFYHPLNGKAFNLYANLPLSWLEIFPRDVLEMLIRENWGYDFVNSGEAHKIADMDFEAPTWSQYAKGSGSNKGDLWRRKRKQR